MTSLILHRVFIARGDVCRSVARGKVRSRATLGVDRGEVWSERGAGGERRGARRRTGLDGVAATEE